MILVRALLCTVLLTSTVGCATATTPTATTPVVPAPAGATPDPMAVSIPAIGIGLSPPLLALHLTAAGGLQAPPLDQPGVGGWYADGVRPGDAGPAVIAAHVNGRVAGESTPGLFARLHSLTPGNPVHVIRTDGSVVTYRVTRVAVYPKTRGVPPEVYDDTDLPELRLITCGGSFDPVARSYRDNVVAWAVQG